MDKMGSAFRSVETSNSAYFPNSDSILRYRFVNIATDELALPTKAALGSAQATLSLPLFNDVNLTMLVAKFEAIKADTPASGYVISGGIVGEEYAISTITLKRDALFAQISLPGKKYRIVPIQPPLHRIDQVDTESRSDTLLVQ